MVKAGRAGWFAKGVVYLLAGLLALSVAVKASGWSDATSATGNREASPTGAIKTVAGSPGGTALLWLLAIGMFMYAAWRVVTALLPGGTDAKAWLHRIGYVVSAIIYSTLAFRAGSRSPATPRSPERQPEGYRHLPRRSWSTAPADW